MSDSDWDIPAPSGGNAAPTEDPAGEGQPPPASEAAPATRRGRGRGGRGRGSRGGKWDKTVCFVFSCKDFVMDNKKFCKTHNKGAEQVVKQGMGGLLADPVKAELAIKELEDNRMGFKWAQPDWQQFMKRVGSTSSTTQREGEVLFDGVDWAEHLDQPVPALWFKLDSCLFVAFMRS